MSVAPPVIPHFSPLTHDYDVVFCDVWGVVHNGVAAFAEPCDALMRARSSGVIVVFLTNSPRPSDAVTRQLDRLRVPREAYDAIVTSGDVTRGVIRARAGQALFHLGPERDQSLFAGIEARFAPLESADYVICTGLVDDENEVPDDYRERLSAMRARNLLMVCGNPDIVVERGPRLIYCAGALAELYAGLGGEVLYAGKPYRPIYDLAIGKAEGALGLKPPLRCVLAIGDSVRTDLAGAHGLGIDCLFITAGIHAGELGGRDTIEADAIRQLFAGAGQLPKAVMRQLVW